MNNFQIAFTYFNFPENGFTEALCAVITLLCL